MSGTCSTHVRNKECIKILVGNLDGRDHWEDLGVDGKVI